QAKDALTGPSGANGATVPKVEPKEKPDAKSVTLAVDPEQAERLVLAEEMGTLRLALRRADDHNVVDLPEATLGTIRAPLVNSEAQITSVQISPTTAKAGDT